MKKTITLLAMLLLSKLSLYAQIAYTDIKPDTTVNTWNYYKIVPAPSSELFVWFHPFSPNEVVVNGFNCDVLWSGGYPSRLNTGDIISSTGTWAEPSYDTLNIAGKYGNWVHNGIDKYIGFSFTVTGQLHYGWLRMDIDSTPTMFTIKDWAYNTVPDAPIKAGETGSTMIHESIAEKPSVSINNKTLSCTCPVDKTYHAMVYNLNGQVLIQTFFGVNNPLDLNAYPTGVYMLRMENKNQQFTTKILLE